MRNPDRAARFNRVITNPVMLPLARRMAPWAVVHHVGRKSGAAYRTPVMAFPTRAGYLVPLGYGPNRDWVRNIVASGSFTLERRSTLVPLIDPVVGDGSAIHEVAPKAAKLLRRLRVTLVLTARHGDLG